MSHIILASHGNLANGMKDTLKMIIGDVSMIESFASYRDEKSSIKDLVEKSVKAKYGSKDIFILTDILGGSVNNEMLSLVKDYPKVHILSGMNLPLVISIATLGDNINEEVLQQIILESQQGVVDCNQLIKEFNNREEENL
eukprot:TRINITY_DN19863_c0_g1_i1.p1 TRINITY_DN19863_c0_g1~~TRINITY_DN19863_c0_g1_i1.p1  ORF type:complete len:141 (+),score=24.11 TRINITY_DN19863_c0_g1_i1:212-634(+)